jgi:hypothetical protein
MLSQPQYMLVGSMMRRQNCRLIREKNDMEAGVFHCMTTILLLLLLSSVLIHTQNECD